MKKRTAVVILLLVLLAMAGLLGLALLSTGMGGLGKSVPAKTLLEVDLETAIPEYLPPDPWSEILDKGTMTTRDVVDALDRAAQDDRVVGLVARVGSSPVGLAQIQEIRDAVARFRAAGKPAIAWGETFGEFAPGNGAYYLATAFDTLYLQPSGDVGLTGMMFESPFLKGTLDKLGVEPRMDHRYEYKNAMNTFTETAYTDAHREAMQTIMDSMFGRMVRDVAAARQLSEDEVRALVDRGPFLGQEAVEAKLVDALGYRDEVYAKAKERAGAGAELLYLDAYLDRAGRPNQKGEAIALIYGVGGVARGESTHNPATGEVGMGSDTVAGALRAAIDDKDVKAILFRVDSPGGSYVASDTIWRETVRAKQAGKPVIVSMGNLAGSGGYFVAMAADKIVAQPGTITGSIGVLGGKMLTHGMWEKIGLSWDEVHTSANARMFTGTHDYSEAEWQRFQAWLDRVYGDFTAKVAEGRGLPLERVQEIAKGRIWSGETAKQIGLVDELGGVDVALKLARAAAGIAPDADVELRLFPKAKSPFEELFGGGASSSEQEAAVQLAVSLLEQARPALRMAEKLGILGQEPGVLSMPVEMVPMAEDWR
ncbi:MAG: signal peptide peptidase SppA [Thermoanaerobaculia bacterium]|nr:signal peptide peptidase SppA [Thermoanaerobaculia bacterium]